MNKEGRQRLRAAVRGGDAAAIMAALEDRDVVQCPQVSGDALVLALSAQVERAWPLAERCVEILRERDWAGDVELANELQAVLGATPIGSQTLLAVPVDLDDVVDALRGDAVCGGGRLDLRSGEVILNPPFDGPALGLDDDDGCEEQEYESDSDRWLAIEGLGSQTGYRDMERFIATCHDARTADLLSRAIDGKGAFRRFRITLESWPELENSWYRYDEERWRGRAREWLADAGYRPASNPSPRLGD